MLLANNPHFDERSPVKRYFMLFLLLCVSAPLFAKTHSDTFNVSCNELWPAVKDTLRNSGKYGIIGIDNSEMTASYNIGGYMGGKRTNSLVLNSKGDHSCEMQVQTVYSGMTHNDAGDLKERVEKSLAKLQAQKASSPTPGSDPAAKEGAVPKEAAAPAETASPANKQ